MFVNKLEKKKKFKPYSEIICRQLCRQNNTVGQHFEEYWWSRSCCFSLFQFGECDTMEKTSFENYEKEEERYLKW